MSKTVNQIIDQLLPALEEWHTCPLLSIYAIVYLDAIHFKGRVASKTIYSLLGIDSDGKKDILGLYYQRIGKR